MERPVFLLLSDEDETSSTNELKKMLEEGDDAHKIAAMKKILMKMVAGEKLPQMLMPIIRFVLTSKNHTIKKLLLIYWEVVDMIGPDGKAIPEMILVCNALRNDLLHPNEYIRGCTLRFVCKLKFAELLEPLVPTIKKNLEHRHPYVRRNAALAVYSVYSKLPILMPDAPELMQAFIASEEDASCKRNAFIMLFHCAQDLAIDYLNSVLDKAAGFADTLQFVVIDAIRRHARQGITDAQKSRYIRCILSLLKEQAHSVQYDAACALLALSQSPIATKAAASTFIQLLVDESDNNVKLIILDKLTEVKKKHGKVLQELLMDVLRALVCPTLDIRKKTLEFAMDLVNPRNIDEVVSLLKKEITKTQSDEAEQGPEYRRILIKAIHSCALRFPDVACNVVHALMEHLGDTNVASALDVINFVAEVVMTYPEHRQAITRRLLEAMGEITSASVLRIALWVVGEYSESLEDIDVAFTNIKESFGPMPLLVVKSEEEEAEEAEKKAAAAAEAKKPPKQVTTTKVLADGTYATQSSYVPSTHAAATVEDSIPFTRAQVLKGNFALASVACYTLAKLLVKLRRLGAQAVIVNTVTAEVLLICVSVLRLAEEQEESFAEPVAVRDSCEDIVLSTKLLATQDEAIVNVMLKEAREKHAKTIAEWKETIDVADEDEEQESAVQVDDLIPIRLIRGSNYIDNDDKTADMELFNVTGANENIADEAGALSRVTQLTGFSDPLYAECYVNVHRYDIVLDVLVMNRTKDTLQDVSLELATLGDLRLCDRSQFQTYTIGPMGRVWIRANLKVSSTETGVIYGNLVYDIAGSTALDKHCVVLNNIRVDIIDYIKPATVTDSQYRSMWYEFEWENKVPIHTKHASVFEFLEDIQKSTNMRCLTTGSQLEGDCGFLAANLYAKSIFGEDALANASVEQLENGDISGYIRIRSKTQGIALSLGDKIAQKSV